MNYVGSAV